MAVSNQTPNTGHIANGATTVFAFGFYAAKASDLVVRVAGFVKALDIDYTVSGVGSDAGGSITFSVAPANGATVTITRSTPLERTEDFQTAGDLRSEDLDLQFDRLWQAMQELDFAVDSVEGGGGGGIDLPTLTGQAGKFLSNDGNNLLWGDPAGAAEKFGINVMDYIPQAQRAAIRAGTSTYDCHAAIQSAINAAANSWVRLVFFPAGRYYIPGDKKLRTYYDAADNPTYPRTRNGHIELVGEGWDSEASGTGTPGNLCGTVFWSDPATVRTQPFLEVSPATEDALPYYGRDFVLRDVSFDGNRASHLVVCRGVPGARFHGVQIRQRNDDGSGLEWGTGYIGGLYGCRIVNSGAGTKTGDAITLRASIEAGLYSIDQDTIAGGYGYGLRVTAGTIQQLNIQSSQLTGAIGGIFVLGGGTSSVEVLNVTGGYGEGACQFWIKGGSEAIRVMNLVGGFVYGAGFTQAAIQIDKPDAVSIRALRVQDLAGTFMNVASLQSLSHCAMTVEAVHFVYTGAISTLRTLFTGMIPLFTSVEWPEGNANCRLHPTTSTPIRHQSLFGADSSMLVAGHVRETSEGLQSPAVNGTTYYHSVQGYPSHASFTGHTGGITYELNNGTSAKLGNFFSVWIHNRGTGAITVTRATLGTTIATVAAGTSKQLFWSDTFNDWLV